MSTPPPHAPPRTLAGLVRTDEPLHRYTNLGVGGPARYFATPHTPEQLSALLRWASGAGLPLFVLGGGTNVVVADAGFAGLVLSMPPSTPPAWPQAGGAPDAGASAGAGRGAAALTSVAPPADVRLPADVSSAKTAGPADADTVVLRLDATCSWDATCRQSVAWGLQGMECLVGIPGTLGASLLQNVGAYGQELGQCLVAVEVVDASSGEATTLPASACGLGYRSSHFKHAWRNRYVVVALHLRLRRGERLRAWPSHAGLSAALRASTRGAANAEAMPAVGAVADAVLALRRAKSMVLDPADPYARSVGSFFVNPHVSAAVAAALVLRLPSLPVYPQATETTRPAAASAAPSTDAGAGAVKVGAAALIEASGLLRGHVFAEAHGRVGLSPHHALALVNLGGARAADVVAAARVVRRQVDAHFGVALEAEPYFVGFADATPYR